MSSKLTRTQLVEQFKNTWISQLSFDCLSDKGKYVFYSIIKDTKFASLSARTLESASGVGHSTIEKIKNGNLVIKDPDKVKNGTEEPPENKKKRCGRHRILTQDEEEYVIRKSEQKRSESKPVTIKWATELCNKKLPE